MKNDQSRTFQLSIESQKKRFFYNHDFSTHALKYSVKGRNMRNKGFTMIELLIVIAIIGILVSIGIPSYKQYIERARFTEVVLATAPFKTAVALALQEGSKMDQLNTGENGIPVAPKSTKNLESISVEQGVITATASQSAGGYTYILTPDEEGAHWQISGTCVKAGICKQ